MDYDERQAELRREYESKMPTLEGEFSLEELKVVKAVLVEVAFVEKETRYPPKLQNLSRLFARRVRKLTDDTFLVFVSRMALTGEVVLKQVPSGKFKVVYSKDMYAEARNDILTHLGGFERHLADMKNPQTQFDPSNL